MNPLQQNLRDLSALDTKLKRVANRRDEMQQAIAKAEAAVADAEATCNARRDEAKAMQREADAMNLEVKSVEGEVQKLENQQRMAKSNKEYDIFKREIEAAKGKVGGLEDGVLERLERMDALRAEEKAAQALLQEAKKALAAATAEASDAESGIAAEEKDLSTQRAEVAAKIEPELRHRYERLLEQRKDSAMAVVAGGVCSRCSRRITRQMEAMLDVGTEIVYCMSCSRILYTDESVS